jgi:hypothetical protein
MTTTTTWGIAQLERHRWIEAGIPVPQVASWAGNTGEIIFKHYCNSTQEYAMPEL